MTAVTHRTAEQIGHTERGPRPLPELGAQAEAAQPSIVDTMIDNGLHVIVVRRPAVPMVELRLRIPFAGTDPMHSARAEVLANALLTGTKRRNRTQVDTDLAAVGGDLAAVVDPERLSVGGSALADGLPVLLDVLADALTEAAYREEEVGREKERLTERIQLARSQPSVIAREALQRYRYGDHPFAKEMPEAEEVARVEPADARALHQAAVLPKGSLLVLVGDIDPDSTVDAVRAALAGWGSAASASVLPVLPTVTGGDALLVHRPGAVQSQIRLSAQAIPRTDPRYPALQIANLVYGGYFSSRLVENIREDKGYTYSAHSYFEFTPSGATLMVDADTASSVTPAALWEARYELGRLGLVPPTEAEVNAARSYAIGSLLTSTASQSGLAGTVAALATVGLTFDWLREHPLRLAAVTGEQIAAAALEFLAPVNFTGVVVGDAEQLAPQLRAIGGVVLP
ncbi:M16 family metallopeptidase [Kutzneria albida]|uniref:M16-like peptidase n=1 Tax=Kutzneria albida DSM 43870 TaxID=1449976 RepID=W5W853_9PSEU|nr:pitrilysin family protein [Kutzneria albida]AHH94404.1 M16-like peptidase [Kutzneria albida DSM 43870]